MGFAYGNGRATLKARIDELNAVNEQARQSLLRQERREAYASVLTALDGFDRALAAASRTLRRSAEAETTVTVEDVSGALDALAVAYDEVDRCIADVALVCDEPTYDALSKIRGDCLDVWKATTERPDEARLVHGGLIFELINAMRVDLGHPAFGRSSTE